MTNQPQKRRSYRHVTRLKF